MFCIPGQPPYKDVQKFSCCLLICSSCLFWVISVKVICWILNASLSPTDEFKGHSLLQAAREADLAKVKKTLALEIINFKQPQSHETALVRLQGQSICFVINVVVVLVEILFLHYENLFIIWDWGFAIKPFVF